MSHVWYEQVKEIEQVELDFLDVIESHHFYFVYYMTNYFL